MFREANNSILDKMLMSHTIRIKCKMMGDAEIQLDPKAKRVRIKTNRDLLETQYQALCLTQSRVLPRR
jgi:hypothetical protein